MAGMAKGAGLLGSVGPMSMRAAAGSVLARSACIACADQHMVASLCAGT